MFNLTRHEKGIIVFLAASIILGYGLIYFQKLNSKAPPASWTSDFYQEEISTRSTRLDRPDETIFVIDINKADCQDLVRLSGIGQILAQRIIDYRNRNGAFKRLEEIKNVSGIGDKKFERIKEFLVLE